MLAAARLVSPPGCSLLSAKLSTADANCTSAWDKVSIELQSHRGEVHNKVTELFAEAASGICVAPVNHFHADLSVK